MTDPNQDLAQLAAARREYKTFVAAVDADLAKERARRLFNESSRIHDLVVAAFANGASLADIKRAYGTKDHNTIKSIIDSSQAEIEERKRRDAERQSGKFHVENDTVTIFHDDGVSSIYNIIELEDEAFMLDGGREENLATEDFYRWDGLVVDELTRNEDEEALYEAILNRRDA